MAIDEKSRNGNTHYNVNRQNSSSKVNNCEYFTGQDF